MSTRFMDVPFRCHTKVRPPIEFLNLGVANPLITQMLLSDNFSMNTKFVDLTEFYKLGFHKKIVTQKHLGDQGVCHTKIEKFYRRTHFSTASEILNVCSMRMHLCIC